MLLKDACPMHAPSKNPLDDEEQSVESPMSITFENPFLSSTLVDIPLWTMEKGGRRISVYTRQQSKMDGVELRYTLDSEFLYSRLYQSDFLGRLQHDLDKHQVQLEGLGWVKEPPSLVADGHGRIAVLKDFSVSRR